MNLDNYTFDELIKLKNKIESRLYSISDGFLYICKVRSYGRNWIERPHNTYILEELCYRYNGDDGIVDVYTTNPNLKIRNYGEVCYIKSEEDYNSWKKWNDLTMSIPTMEKELEQWENRDNLPFNYRPIEPYFTRDTLDRYKKQLAEYDMNFEKPVNIMK